MLLVAWVLVAGCTSRVPAAAPGTGAAAPGTGALTPASAATAAATATATARATATATVGPAAAPTPRPSPVPTVAQLIGQKLVVAMDGTIPSADLLGRIRRGEVGGIILFGRNITSRSALIGLTATLRGAAAAGHQPRLLIAVDQEGGPVKRIPWAPPTLSAPQMGHDGRAWTARSQGAMTGAALRGLGMDVDFAPVADVPATTASFMYRGGRTFSFDGARTALLADAFASGLRSRGVVAAMKHFPGIGFATRNTDASVVSIGASTAALAPGLLPYRTAIGHGIPLIMLSNATYPAYDPFNAAGWSRRIGYTLLRRDLGFTGVTITDSLDGTAHRPWAAGRAAGRPRGEGGDRHDPGDRLGGVDAGGVCGAPR